MQFHFLTKQNKSDNTVTAYFRDGQNRFGNILIGSDGVNSNVRRSMIGDEDNI